MFSPIRIAISTGQAVIDKGASLSAMFNLFAAAARSFVKSGISARSTLYRQVSSQILFTGVEAFGLVSLVAFISGSTIVIQAMSNMPKLGVSDFFGKLLVMVVVRELGPLFTALVVIGRSGSALAAYVGSMKVNKEVAALQVMGVDPIGFLVVPALAGMICSMVCLNLYFDLIAIIGGLAIAQVTVVNMSLINSLGTVMQALSAHEILISLIKSSAFGCIIATVSCHYGLKVSTIRGVPLSAIKSVVSSMAGTIVVTIIVTVIMSAMGLYAL